MCKPFKSVVQCRLNFPRALFWLKAAHLNQQVVVTGGLDGNNIDEVFCGILKLIVFYLAFVSRCFSTMLRQERGEKLGNFKSSEMITPSLKLTLLLSVKLLVISFQSKRKIESSLSLAVLRSYVSQSV